MTDDMQDNGDQGEFDLEAFLPYLINKAAEVTSKSFQPAYKGPYGMTRTQWRVLANLGKFGALTARDICRFSHIEKTKVSRAVAALEYDALLKRDPSTQDRRAEILTLTDRGKVVFEGLGQRASAFDAALRAQLGADVAANFEAVLRRIVALGSSDSGDDTD
ncbi:MAG: MarR family transcriptional regulator [bacterium]